MTNDSRMKSEPGRESGLGNPGENQKRSSESQQVGPDSGSTGPGAEQGQSGAPKAEAELEVILAKQSLELSKTISMLKEAIGGRSEAEKFARATQERFGRLCEITSDLVYIHDLSGKITSFNRAAEKLTGYTREEALQLNLADLIAPGYRDLIPSMLDPHHAEGATTSYQMELVAKDGRRIPVKIMARFIYWEGNPVGILGAAAPSPEADPSRAILRRPSAELLIRLEEETAELSRTNTKLREQIAIHERAEAQLRKRTGELEALLEEGNAELSRSATLFREEMFARERSQEVLKRAFDDFEDRLRQRMSEHAVLNESLKREVTGRERAEAELWKTTADFEVRQQQFQTELLKTQELLREESSRRKAAEEAVANASSQFQARLEELTSELSRANAALTEQIAQHEQGEDALRKTFEDLEARIGEKSAELSKTDETLQEEISRRQRAEEELARTRAEFEKRLAEQGAELTKTAEQLEVQSNLRALAEEGLERAKSELGTNIRGQLAIRHRAEEELEKARAEFEARMGERVSLLAKAGEELKEEFNRRDRAEDELKVSLLELEKRLEEQKAELSIAGELLEAQSALRGVAEEGLEKAKAELEARVAEGVAQLAKAGEELKQEFRRRGQAEEDLKKTAEELETRLEEGSADLLKASDLLKDQIVEHERIQTVLQKTISELQAQLNERTGELSKVKTILQEEVAALESAQESFDVTIGEIRAAPHEPAPESRDLLLLGDLGNLLRACASIDEAYRVIGRAAPQIFPNLNGALYVINPSGKILGAVAHWGRMVPDERTFAAAECWALRTGRVHWVEDTRGGLVCRHLQSPPPGEYVCVPMFSLGEILGMLHLSHPSKGNISLGTIRLATTVGEYLAMAMSHLRHAGSPAMEMLCDPLTGLFNRRFMEDSLELGIHRCVKKEGTLAMILLDLDRFSFFHESFGQDVGDQLLREVARLLQASIREADLACRSGGAEFVLLMPGGTLEVALNRAQQLRESVKQLSVFQIGQTYGQITVSIGVAGCPDNGQSEADVLSAAEGALRQAKREGGDRVVVAR